MALPFLRTRPCISTRRGPHAGRHGHPRARDLNGGGAGDVPVTPRLWWLPVRTGVGDLGGQGDDGRGQEPLDAFYATRRTKGLGQ